MYINAIPAVLQRLLSDGSACENELFHTHDGFWMLFKSFADILLQRGILYLPTADGNRLDCDKFFDDWYLFAVPFEGDYVYSLLKLREQEHDAEGDSPADGDTPGVTISFVPFSCDTLLRCLEEPTDENRKNLEYEIDCVVARRGQKHHKSLKRYFIDPKSEGPYLVADAYVRHIVSFAEDATLDVPEHYGEIAKNKSARLRVFVESVNKAAGRTVCDHEKIYFQNTEKLSEHECAVILATHTGNTSVYSFAAEVEYHARFLVPLTKIKIPFLKKTVYDSAVRADMTIEDAEYNRFAPFYRVNSHMVKRQYRLHKKF
jgi:hypothetical protein